MIFDDYMVNRCIAAMNAKGYKVYEEGGYPFNLNIVGIRTARPVLDQFKCWISIFWKFDNIWHKEAFRATTLPGKYHLIYKLLNIKGCAILAEQQIINGYEIGLHKGQYPALVQTRPFKIFRDNNVDEYFDFEHEDVGNFGINIHRAAKEGTTPKVGPYSAGCQVFEKAADFDKFMLYCRQAAINFGNKFTYTLLNEKDLI